MNIKKVDDKPMVIHTKEKTKLYVKTAPETKIKAGNVLTVERTPKFAGAEREAKADNMDKRMSALKVKFSTKDSNGKADAEKRLSDKIGQILFLASGIQFFIQNQLRPAQPPFRD